MESIIRGNQNTTDLCNYLKRAQEQYPTLNKQQEQVLISEFRNNRDELNKRLFMHNIRIVFNIAKKYVSKTNDFDGLVQDGMLGLAEAVKRFDIDKKIKFITYATIWVRKYILMNFYGKQIEVDKRSTSLNVAIDNSKSKSNNGNEVTFENFINDFIDPSCYQSKSINEELSSNEQIDICKNLISYMNKDSSLSATDKSVFIDIYYNGKKPSEVAEEYKLSTLDVTDIRKKILGKFKDILHNEYNVNSYADIAAM
jgi:RNA polymerase sigma factor (sigma-70 family)